MGSYSDCLRVHFNTLCLTRRLRVLQLDVMIVVQSLLEGEEYLWLKNLCRFPNPEDFNRMARQAIESPNDTLRDLLIQFIAEVNPELWKEEENVCEVFKELERRGEERGRKEGHREGRKEGHREGRKEGRKEGEEQMLRLIQLLMRDNRMDDIMKAEDVLKRAALFKEYGIIL